VPRKNSVPSYRLRRGSGQAVAHVNGRDVYFGVHDSTERKEKYQDIVRKVRADPAKAETQYAVRFHVDITVAELAAKYVRYAETYYVKGGKQTSQVATIKSAINVLLVKYSHLEAARFGPLALKDCRDVFVDLKLARTEVNRRVGLIRGMFKWGVSITAWRHNCDLRRAGHGAGAACRGAIRLKSRVEEERKRLRSIGVPAAFA
jgi:hypothetical protein